MVQVLDVMQVKRLTVAGKRPRIGAIARIWGIHVVSCFHTYQRSD